MTQGHPEKEARVKRAEFINGFKIHFSNMEKQTLRPEAQNIKVNELLGNYE